MEILSKSITLMLFGEIWMNSELITYFWLKLVYRTRLQGKLVQKNILSSNWHQHWQYLWVMCITIGFSDFDLNQT